MNPGSYDDLYESSKELLALWEAGLVSPEDEEFNEFEILKEIAFIESIYYHVHTLTYDFIDPFTTSYAREYTLADEIALVNEKIQNIKTAYPTIYADVLTGNDGRYSLGFEEIKAIFNSNHQWFSEQTLSRHLELIVYMKYLDILKWIGNTENKGVVDNYVDYIKEQKKNLKWPVYKESKRLRQLIDKVAQTNQVSYTWLDDPDIELPKLYLLLIDKKTKLIHPDTTLEQFKVVFTAKPLHTIERIKWNKANNLLAYFIDRIQHNGKIAEPNLWSLAERCFTKSKDLLQARNNYERINKNKKPKNFNVIDDILNDLQ